MGFFVFLFLIQDRLLVFFGLFVLFFSSFLSLWFCSFMPTENKLYDKAETSTVKMTSLWDLGEMVPRKRNKLKKNYIVPKEYFPYRNKIPNEIAIMLKTRYTNS